MNHFQKIAAQLEAYDLDAMLLTEEANRFYASGFHSTGTDGVALVTRKKAYYFIICFKNANICSIFLCAFYKRQR